MFAGVFVAMPCGAAIGDAISSSAWVEVAGAYSAGIVWFTAFYLSYPYVAAYEQVANACRLCMRCGYNLTGNLSGVCPECGKKIGEVVRA